MTKFREPTVLNIFLRDALYTVYLRDAYRMELAEAHLELPLDSITAKELKKAVGRGKLPAWPGVSSVTPEFNARFQAAAAPVAADYGVARVHLDAFWWSATRDNVSNRPPVPG